MEVFLPLNVIRPILYLVLPFSSYEIQAHNSRKFEIDLNGTKDVLRKGIYRISKIVKFRGEELVVSDEVTIHEKK